MRRLSLDELRQGETAKIEGCIGGHGLTTKLNAMGIFPGKNLKVISNSSFGGPVTIQVNSNKIAIGRGMAHKIFVKVDKK